MTRIFMDANVLFSAVYRENTTLLRLWQISNVALITSAYAVQEATVNLNNPEQRNRLAKLLKEMGIHDHTANPPQLPAAVNLPGKDIPILQATISGKADILLTGDVAHFGLYFGKTIHGVRIMRPGDFLRRKANNGIV